MTRAGPPLLLLLLLLPTAPAAAEAPCARWPGEPEAAGAAGADDGALTRWAELRALELQLLAERLAPGDPLGAERALRHAHCLAPGVVAGRPTVAVRVHRPDVRRVARRPVADDASVEATVARVGETIAVIGEAPARAPAPRPVAAAHPPAPAAPSPEPVADPAPPPARVARVAPPPVPRPPAAPPAARRPEAPPSPPPVSARPPPAKVDEAAPPRAEVRSLSEAQEALRGARFEQALESAADARASLDAEAARSGEATVRAERAQLALVEGTAQLALGRDDQARESFRRAQALDPELALDPKGHSPKVRRAFAAARGATP